MENGTLLHIAATNFAWKTIQVLVKNGANTSEKDDLGRLPLGIYSIVCIPFYRKVVMNVGVSFK